MEAFARGVFGKDGQEGNQETRASNMQMLGRGMKGLSGLLWWSRVRNEDKGTQRWQCDEPRASIAESGSNREVRRELRERETASRSSMPVCRSWEELVQVLKRAEVQG